MGLTAVVSAVLLVALSTILPSWAPLYIAMGSSVLVFWLFPSWFPAAINQFFKWNRVKGRVSAAHASVTWPGLLAIDIDSLTLTNPEGYEHPALLLVSKLGVTVDIWSMFSRCVKVLRLEADEVTICLERKEGLGINSIRYYNYVTRGTAEDFDKEEYAHKHQATILSLLGAHNIIEVVSDNVDGAGGILQMAGQSIHDTASELAASVAEAGGIGKWAEEQVASTMASIGEKGKDLEGNIADHGLLGGVMDSWESEVQTLTENITTAASDAVLYEDLHQKIAG
ncbi:hypothetical protein T484DRAFT_1793850 [Baffinella frigidus]|nr:hypothetical protein T484DRAFT_1793850 [Cryptophyta sp. CCMP2293]